MKKKKEHDQLKPTDISCVAPEAEQVFVAGTFNDWNPNGTPMHKIADGTWKVTLKLPTGSYEYKFIVDGRWVCEPGADEYDPGLGNSLNHVPNVFGSMNRKLKV